MSSVTRPFVHLHCHTHYSLLDGAGSIDRLVQRAASYGMNALAITDHGNLHGAIEFYRECKAADINPIIGYEAYIAPGSRKKKDGRGMRDSSYHLTLLAQNRTGFNNLVKMASSAFLEGFYFKPRIDKELLQAHHEGLVCLSGCPSSEFARTILRGGAQDDETIREALEIAGWFRNLFGDRYFIEIQNNGTEIQRQVLAGAREVSQRAGIPMVATCDTHYVDAEDADAQDVMLCINTGRFRTDTNRMRMDTNTYYLRSQEETYDAFADYPDAVARTQEIADAAQIDLDLGKRHFPSFRIPNEGQTAEEFLRELCIQGLKERYAGNEKMAPGGELSDVVMARLERELEVINKLGFPNYFLIVWDFVREAREKGIPATARGSGVGALVCYALYLSHVCPIQYDLLFERFLDENRLEAPDIDIDFCKERRGEIIRYVKELYGEDNVAQIGTFNTLAAKAAIKDVGRVLGVPLNKVAQITAKVPEELNIKLEKALATGDELNKLYHEDPEVQEVVDLARKIEGLARNIGTHAAAVVIADKPLTEYVPLACVSGKTDVITQWSMNDVEAAGLLKMDFLGLRNLTILSKAVELVQQTTGKKIDPQQFPLDDGETFALLCRGETKGIFQLESGGIRDLLQRMKPDRFLDIVATNALYRPGPLKGGMVDEYVDVKHGRKKPVYKHPVLEEILTETNGVMVYQEQVMRILNRLGGIPLAAAYTCIKAISKKKEKLIATNYEAFIEGATKNGLSKKEAQEFWDLIKEFAGYGFNKSHSTAYALIAYQTAYLKAHYPVEFMAALLSGDIPGRNFKKKDSLVEHLEDCRRMGIIVEPPSVNRSDSEFTVRDGAIVFGLAAVKNCGGAAPDAIKKAREQDGPFKDIFEFCERVDPHQCNRATIETLVKAGAFDCFGASREQHLAVIEKALQSGAGKLADRKSGQKGLFDAFGEDDSQEPATVTLPDVPEMPERERLMMEKEVLGFYLSNHPLAEHEATFKTYCTHSTADVPELKENAEVIMGGMIGAIKPAQVRNPRPGATHTRYANFDLEDMHGSIRCILWPEDYARHGELVKDDAIVALRGRIDRRGGGDEANLIVNEVVPLAELSHRYTRGLVIRIDEASHGTSKLKDLKEILRGYPGGLEVKLRLDLEDGRRVHMQVDGLKVQLSPELRQRVDNLLGGGNVQVIAAGGGNGARPRAG